MTNQRVKQQPLRTCIACREKREQGDFIRVAATKDGTVTVDHNQKLPGRGAYLCMRLECVKQAKKKDSLRRALKCSIPEEIWTDIECVIAANESNRIIDMRKEKPREAIAQTDREGREDV